MSGDQQAAIKTVSQSLTLSNGKVLPNRFLKSAMTERLCTWGDDVPSRGKPTPEYIRLYEEWGRGEIGTIVLGNLPTDARYPEAIHNACIDPTANWNQVEAFKPVIKGSKGPEGKNIVIGQLTHAGRQTANHVAKEPISSSDVQSPPLGGMEFNKPRPATVDEIHDIVKRFGFAAKVLYDAGADGAQLHCAHGYLLSQFLSPRVNRRTDQYGGSLENRSRILFEILDEIKRQVPDDNFIRSIKINSADFSEGGFSEDESRETCQKLEAAGMHLIELSGGTYESLAFAHQKESTKKREAFFIEFAERIRPHLKSAKLCVTGGFRSVLMMAQALNEGSCDIVGIARPLTGELDLPKRLMSGQQNKAADNLVGEGVQLPASYMQLKEVGDGKQPSDLSNPDVAKKVQAAIEKDPAGAMRLHPILHKDY